MDGFYAYVVDQEGHVINTSTWPSKKKRMPQSTPSV
jgi:hypothetical protein